MPNAITYVINANPGGNRKSIGGSVAAQNLTNGIGKNPYGEVGGIRRTKFSTLSSAIGTNVSNKLGGT